MGGKKGKGRKFLNLIIVFMVSGIWHGGRWKFVAWGLLHAFYQIGEEKIYQLKENIIITSLSKESKLNKLLENIITLFLIMVAWIIFRADSLRIGIKMIISMLTTFNPWVFFDDSLFRKLSQKEFGVLFISVTVMVIISFCQEKGIWIREWFNKQFFIFRWIIYMCAIWSIWIFGTYGYGFDAQDFIYGGF